MAARGHNWHALLHEYSMDLVLQLHRAAQVNRQREQLGQAEAITLGIAAAFNPGAHLLEGVRQELAGRDVPETPAAELNPEVMASLFGGVPLRE